MTSIHDSLAAGTALPRHQHASPYITLVLGGRYREAGDQGRFDVRPGDVLVHENFSSHANWIAAGSDVQTINMELKVAPPPFASGTTPMFDDFVRLPTPERHEALDTLIASITPHQPLLFDWPDLLAEAIREHPDQSIRHWSRHFELAPATISRGFKRAYGVTAVQYRSAARARKAHHELMHGSTGFVELAHRLGFSDQAHFTRAVRALTGAPPKHWRDVKNLQDR